MSGVGKAWGFHYNPLGVVFLAGFSVFSLLFFLQFVDHNICASLST